MFTSTFIFRAVLSSALLIIASPAMASLPFQTVDKGTYSGIEDSVNGVYRTKQDFDAFWTRHGSNSIPSPLAPDVDFSSRMVVAVYWGTKTTGGFDIEITSVDEGEEGGDLVVNYVTSSPPPGDMLIMSLTQPYHMISIDASDKKVIFEGSVKPQEAPPQPQTQKLMVGFVKDADTDAIVQKIEASPHVTKVKMLGSLKILFVDVDSDGKDEVMTYLKEIEGVRYVEEDQ